MTIKIHAEFCPSIEDGVITEWCVFDAHSTARGVGATARAAEAALISAMGLDANEVTVERIRIINVWDLTRKGESDDD
jgi:hypothetical protein